MSTAKYIGDPTLAVRTRTERDPARGVRQSTVYTFATEALANTFISSLGAYQGYVKDQDPPNWTVAVFTPDYEDPLTTPDYSEVWELLANHVEKDLYEHPTSKAISASDIEKIRKAVKSPPGDSGTLTGDAATLYGLLIKGTTKYPEDEYVFRYTLTISSRSALVASFLNCGKIFTNAQLVTSAVGGLAAIPSGIGFAIGSITPKTPPSGFAWGWVKKTPTCRQTRPGKIEIIQEWWLDLWSTYIYKSV